MTAPDHVTIWRSGEALRLYRFDDYDFARRCEANDIPVGIPVPLEVFRAAERAWNLERRNSRAQWAAWGIVPVNETSDDAPAAWDHARRMLAGYVECEMLDAVELVA